MRLIDADKLVNSLKNNLHSFEEMISEHGKGLAHGTRIALGLVKEQPTIAPENPQPQWIPVTERMPKTSKQYLVTVDELRWPKNTYDSVDSPTERLFVTSMYFDCTNKLWHDSDSFVINALIDPEDVLDGCVAVAWMPLPEPYTADAEENECVQPAHWEKADIPLPYQMRTVPTPSGTFAHREMYVCSACDGYNDKNTQYCPHCGAKMDKEANDDD